MKEVIARLKIGKETFEVYVDFEEAIKLKEGKPYDKEKLLLVPEIFRNVKTGERQSEEVLKKVFKTTDVYVIAEQIIKKGQLQIPTEYKRKIKEELKRKIIELIRKNYIDPRTGLPYTYQRIELAMEKAKINIDITKPAEAQLESIVKELKKIIPLKGEKIRIVIKIPNEYIYKAYSYIKSFRPQKEEFSDNYYAILSLPAGIYQEFIEKIEKLTEGNAEIKELERY